MQVNGGRLAGKGTIAGAVTVGSGLGREAVLSPGYHHSLNPGTLTIQSPLIFNSDATYEIEVNSSSETVDKVVALGVTINVGAQTLFADLGNGTFTVGNVFTVIDNTSATPIAGTFSNLARRLDVHQQRQYLPGELRRWRRQRPDPDGRALEAGAALTPAPEVIRATRTKEM